MDVQIACPCPPKRDGTARHESDTVTLRDTLPPRDVHAIVEAVGIRIAELGEQDVAEMAAVLFERYSLHGIVAWTLTDDKGAPLPLSRGAIRERILTSHAAANAVYAAVDPLYQDLILGEWEARVRRSSQPGPTDASTSASDTGASPRPTPSRRSSTTTSPTDGIVTISGSRASASSSSRSSTSAA